MHTIRRALTAQAAVLIALALLTARDGAAQATSYHTLYSFKGDADGASPNGVTLGESGSLYGTTFTGGTNECATDTSSYPCGTVFELAPVKGTAWTKTALFSFNGADGALPSPSARLVFGGAGELYGTTAAGGANDSGGSGFGGTVFELVPPSIAGGVWTETVLSSFSSSLDAPHTPYSGVLVGPKGALYGTTFSNYWAGGMYGYEAGGTAFELTPPTAPGGSWTVSTLANFWTDGALGYNPTAGLAYAGGSFFGTTYETSASGCGAVYELSPPTAVGGAWTGTPIHAFEGADGCYSAAPLIVGPAGVLYGTTISGGDSAACVFGVSFGCGAVFQLTPPATAGGAWAEAVIYSFTALNGDGAYPSAGVTLGNNGVLYGTTTYGGSAISGSPCSNYGPAGYGPMGCGTVFELTPPATLGGAWTETILHSFTGQNGDGSIPGPLTMNQDGVLFGPTSTGGTAGHGTIFALVP
jgi:hypothetical protein